MIARSALATLTPAQRERLARLQRDPRVAALVRGERDGAAHERSTSARVEAHARVEPDGAVILTAKGLRLVNGANEREHWRPRAARVTREREIIARALASITPPAGPWRVTILRDGRGTMDTDGLAIAAKAVRDEVASWLEVDDAPDAPVTWGYVQRRAKGYAVTVRVEALPR